MAEDSIEKRKLNSSGNGSPSKLSLIGTYANLVDIRVIQRDLVYVVGLPVEYANEDTLLKYEFFGQYGAIKKIVVNSTHIHSSPSQVPSVSVYVTFRNNEDATECIYSLESFVLNGSQMKASFGTTKYCTVFLRGQKCTNPDCMYLHECGEPSDSFSKDEITGNCNRFVELTRPSRPSDYNEYPKQDAIPTIFPPRRLMKKEIPARKHNILQEDLSILLADEFDEEEEVDNEDFHQGVSLVNQLSIRRIPFRAIYNSVISEGYA
jgi:hypothetical protein